MSDNSKDLKHGKGFVGGDKMQHQIIKTIMVKSLSSAKPIKYTINRRKPNKHTLGEQMQYPITNTIEIKRNADQ